MDKKEQDFRQSYNLAVQLCSAALQAYVSKGRTEKDLEIIREALKQDIEIWQKYFYLKLSEGEK